MLGLMAGLVHQRDEGAAGNQLPQNLRQHGIAHQLCHADMKVSQQLGAAGHVFPLDSQPLLRDMLAQRSDFVGRDFSHEAPRHFSLQHAAHHKNLLSLLDRGRGHKGAARRLQPDQLIL